MTPKENIPELDIETKSGLQDSLEQTLNDVMVEFFLHKDVIVHKLIPIQMDDLECGALITLFTKKLAYIAAKEPDFDHQEYLDQVFTAVSELFKKTYLNYTEALKGKSEKKLDVH